MRLHLRFSGVVAAVAAIAALTVVMSTDPAPAQEFPAAKETIFARKILMGAIDINMDEIETMLAPTARYCEPRMAPYHFIGSELHRELDKARFQ